MDEDRFDDEKIEQGVRLILEGIGEDPTAAVSGRRRHASRACTERSSRGSGRTRRSW